MDNIQYKIKNKKNLKRFMYSYVTLFVVLGLTSLILLETLKFVDKKNKIKANSILTENEISKLDKSIQNKKNEMEKLNTLEGKESYFRETLPVAGDGERVFILYNSSNSSIQEIPHSAKSSIYELKMKVKYFIDKYTNL